MSVSMQSTRYSFHIVMKLELSGQILQNDQVSGLMKIRPEGVELFHADGRTGWRMDRQTD